MRKMYAQVTAAIGPVEVSHAYHHQKALGWLLVVKESPRQIRNSCKTISDAF